jgi:hypothetical protein
MLTLTLAHGDQIEPLPVPQRSPRLSGTSYPPSAQAVSSFSFTALLVLLTEVDSNDRKVLGEQESQLTSYQWRFVGLS